MAIPKKIHWCWLSGDPLPKIIQDCVNSWKRIMPDYEFVLWDMNRFDVHSVKFVEDACAARKWAFAADYIRFYALYTEGGIYFDSDVMVYRRFDDLLDCSAFTGTIEYPAKIRLSDNSILDLNWFLEAEMIGAEINHPFIKACLDFYDTKTVFQVDEKGNVLNDIAPGVITRVAYEQFGLNPNQSVSKLIKLRAGIVIHQPTVLGGVKWRAVNIKSYANHLCYISWRNTKRKSSFVGETYERLCAKFRLITTLYILWKKIRRFVVNFGKKRETINLCI